MTLYPLFSNCTDMMQIPRLDRGQPGYTGHVTAPCFLINVGHTYRKSQFLEHLRASLEILHMPFECL